MKEDSVYLNHILDSIKNVFSDTKDFTLENFLENRQVKDAVTRNVEIIGEAVKRLSNFELRNTNFSSVRIFRSLKNPEVLTPSRSKPLRKVMFRNSKYLKKFIRIIPIPLGKKLLVLEICLSIIILMWMISNYGK